MKPAFFRALASLALGLGLALHAAAALAQPKLITIAAEDDWPPYSSAKADGSGPEGLTPELVRAVFKSRNIEVKFLVVPFARCLHLTQQGKVVACFNATITEENRDEYWWHPTPIFHEGLSIFALADFKGSGLTTRDLEGHTVGLTTGYTYPSEVMNNPKIIRYEANSDELLLKMIAAKRIKFALVNTLPGLLRVKNDARLNGTIKIVGQVSNDGFWLSFSKKHAEGKAMAETFEAGLKAFKADGRYEKLINDFRKRQGLGPVAH